MGQIGVNLGESRGVSTIHEQKDKPFEGHSSLDWHYYTFQPQKARLYGIARILRTC